MMSSSNRPSSSSSQLQSETKFPTNGLKSLLKNSDLLEILLKPLSKTPEILNLSPDLTQMPNSPSISLENVSPGSSSSNLVDLNNNINIIQQLDILNEYNDFSDKLEPKQLASPEPNHQQQQQQQNSSSKMASNYFNGEGEYLERKNFKCLL